MYSPSPENLAKAVLAFQNGLVDRSQLLDLATALADPDSASADDLLVDFGFCEAQESHTLKKLLELNLAKHGRDAEVLLRSLRASGAAGQAFEILDRLQTNPATPSRVDNRPSDGTVPETAIYEGVRSDVQAGAGGCSAASHQTDATESYPGSGSGKEERPEAEPVDECDLVDRMETREDSKEKGKSSQYEDTLPPGSDSLRQLTGRSSVQPGGKLTRYKIVKKHARGGLGEVFLAEDQELNRRVALKEIRARWAHDENRRSRFILEAELTGSLEHPGIVPVYGLGRYQDGRPFYAMRFIRGETLKDAIERYHEHVKSGISAGERELEFRGLLHRFIDVCNAIAYAHRRGVLHRDLKPSNIMLGEFGETLVVDWGLAKPAKADEHIAADEETLIKPPSSSGTSQTQWGSRLGTLGYMSPEQAEGKVEAIDTSSDIYGLGATLYHLLTGQVPHPREEKVSRVIGKICRGDFPRPREANPLVPRPLDAICQKAMSLGQADRYASARELADDMERWLADEPVSAWKEPFFTRLARWTRRHRTIVQAAAITLVTITVVAIIAALMVDKSRRQEVIAKQRAEESLRKEEAAVDKANAALAAEQEARRETLRNFRMAREAADKWLIGVDNILRHFPNVLGYRKSLLELAVQDYEKFANQTTDDPQLQVEFAHTYLFLADIHRLRSDLLAAEEALQKARSIFLTLQDSDADPVEIETELAVAESRLGRIHDELDNARRSDEYFTSAQKRLKRWRVRDPDSSELLAAIGRLDYYQAQSHVRSRSFDQGLKLAASAERQLFAATGMKDDPAYNVLLADVQLLRGQVLNQLGRNDEAARIFRSAVIIFSDLAESDPQRPHYQDRLAMSRTYLASALGALGRSGEQVKAYERAIDDYLVALQALPDIPHFQASVAETRTNLAMVLHNLGQNHEAELQLLKARDLLTELRKRLPKVPRYLSAQTVVAATLGQVYRDLDRNSEAKRELTSAIEILAHPDLEPEYRFRGAVCRSALGRLHHKLGEYDDAVTQLKQAIAETGRVRAEYPSQFVFSDAEAWARKFLGDAYFENSEVGQAREEYSAALELREGLWKSSSKPAYHHDFALLLADCRFEQLRDPVCAIEIAQELASRVRSNGKYWTLLGIARYRNKEFGESVVALEKSVDLGGDESGKLEFWLAMAYFQRNTSGDRERAEKQLSRAVEKMESNAPGRVSLRRVRDEAGKLINSE